MNRLTTRSIAILFTLVLLTALASACGNGKPAADAPSTTAQTQTVSDHRFLGTIQSRGFVPAVGSRAPRSMTNRPGTSPVGSTPTTVKTKTTPAPPSSGPGPSRQIGPCVAGFVCGHVTAIGDSVMLDAEPDLVADIPGVDVEAVVSRQWDSGVELVQEMRADRTLGSIVVVDLGTNGPVDIQQFQEMMQALSGVSIVEFVTVHLPPSYSWANSVNETLETEVPLYRNARLADFNALADANPEWFGPDGVHMAIGGTGAEAMAHLIASGI